MTAISYQLPAFSQVELSIYNLLGQKVATLVSEKQPAGVYEVQWDASGFSSGVYFYQLTTNKEFSNAEDGFVEVEAPPINFS
jgi:flagellar hook assembly protein FlgD